MTENRVLSVGDIAKETGLSRQRIWQLARSGGGIPGAKRANPGGKHHRFRDSAPFVAWRKEKAQQSARPRARQVRRRAYRRRQEKIEKLREILENQTEVSASDKKAALLYYGCLLELTDAMSHLYMLGWWVRPWKMKMTQQRIPLLEGIHALFESKLVFGDADPEMDALVDFESAIKRLPTRSETTPQTEQSSLNVSD